MNDLLVIQTAQSVIDSLYRQQKVGMSPVTRHLHLEELNANRYVTLKNGKQSALGYLNLETETIDLISTKDVTYHGVKALDGRQSCMLHGLKHFPLFIALGGAGTGKTTLSMAYAIHQLFRNDKNIVLCKPTTFVGQKSNAIAAIPGDHREKMAGYIDSFLVTLRRILGDHAEHHMYEWEEKQKLTFKPLELLRGMHFENSVVILDEAQNTSPHELLTLMSRVDDTSQLIVMGDALQIDTQERFADTGLGTIIGSDAFLDSDYSAFIKLKTQYRGVLADLAINVLQELSPNDDDHVKKVLYTPTL